MGGDCAASLTRHAAYDFEWKARHPAHEDTGDERKARGTRMAGRRRQPHVDTITSLLGLLFGKQSWDYLL